VDSSTISSPGHRASRGLCVGLYGASRTVALSPDTAIESGAPTSIACRDLKVLEWIASQMRGKFRGSRNAMKLIAAIIGAATSPLTQLPNLFDMVSPGERGE
jgi:hypothetical protein